MFTFYYLFFNFSSIQYFKKKKNVIPALEVKALETHLVDHNSTTVNNQHIMIWPKSSGSCI